MKKFFYSKIILTILLVAGGFFSLPSSARADYYPMSTALSTNLLSGKSDVAQITFFKATATVPANTTLSVQYSQDGANFFDHNYVAGGWDTLAAGTNTIDLGALNWTTANFYYRVQFTTTDPAATAALTQAEVDYSSTYTPWTPPWGSGYVSAGTTVSTDLLAGLGTQFQNGAYFAYKIATLPAGTVVTAQFSTDGANWFSSAGTAWMADTLSLGDHTTKTSALSLAALNWSGASSFYYKLNFSTTNSANSASVTAAGLLFTNVQLGGTAVVTVPPIASYDFNEGYGGTAHNGGSLGSAADGTLQSGGSGTNTTATAMWDKGGKFGGAMEFDGTDDSVDMNDAFYSDVFSVCAWVNEASFKTQANVVVKRNIADEWEFSIANGYPRFTSWINIAFSLSMTSSSPITANSWHHICAVQNGNGNTGYIYVDGLQQGSAMQTAAMANTASIVQVGSLSNGNNTRYFNGRLDDVKIYNYALDANQVNTLYNNGAAMTAGNDASRNDNGTTVTGANKDYCVPGDTAQCDKPVGEWKFDTGSGATAYDTSGNGNDGTWNGAGLHWTPGKFGKAGSFNGTNDYVGIGTAISSVKTVSFWIKPSTITQSIVNLDGGAHKISISGGAVTATGFNSYYVDGNLSGAVPDTAWHQITAIANTAFATTTSMTIGEISPVYFSGVIDQVQIFNYARTPSQIAWDYNHGGPIAEWRMNECSGTTIHDESGNGNNGTLNLGSSGQTSAGTCSANANTSWWNGRTGKYDASLNFDGTDDYTDIPNVSSLKPQLPITIAAWIKANSVSGSGPIFSNDVCTTNNYYGVWLGISDGKLNINFGSGGIIDPGSRRTKSSTTTLATNQWYHVAAIIRGATDMDLYINGVNDGGSYSGSGGSLLYSANTGAVGRKSSVNGVMSYFNGKIDNVKIFNYALTAEQIKQDYNGGAVGF